LRQHLFKVRMNRSQFGFHAETLAQDDARQLNGCSRAEIHREPAYLQKWAARDEENAAHNAPAGNADARDHLKLLPRDFGHRDETYLYLALLYFPCANGGNGKTQIYLLALLSMQHAPDQRDWIEIANRAYGYFLQMMCQPLV
jgi:hypothetical protein